MSQIYAAATRFAAPNYFTDKVYRRYAFMTLDFLDAAAMSPAREPALARRRLKFKEVAAAAPYMLKVLQKHTA
jgi:hypothetical protein